MNIWETQMTWYAEGSMEELAVALWGSSTFPRVLAGLLEEPDREFSFADLIAQAGANRESVHRAIRRALAAGLVTRRRIGNQFVYRVRLESPIRAEMTALMAKTHGIQRQLAEALTRLGSAQVEAAFLFGSAARGSSRSDSDIDLLVLGSATRIDIARSMREVQERVGRRINAIAYTRAEVVRRLDEGDAFFLEVWAQPKVMLVGTENQLPPAPAHAGQGP
jgi:predicted nucleotidyltransferase